MDRKLMVVLAILMITATALSLKIIGPSSALHGQSVLLRFVSSPNSMIMVNVPGDFSGYVRTGPDGIAVHSFRFYMPVNVTAHDISGTANLYISQALENKTADEIRNRVYDNGQSTNSKALEKEKPVSASNQLPRPLDALAGQHASNPEVSWTLSNVAKAMKQKKTAMELFGLTEQDINLSRTEQMWTDRTFYFNPPGSSFTIKLFVKPAESGTYRISSVYDSLSIESVEMKWHEYYEKESRCSSGTSENSNETTPCNMTIARTMSAHLNAGNSAHGNWPEYLKGRNVKSFEADLAANRTYEFDIVAKMPMSRTRGEIKFVADRKSPSSGFSGMSRGNYEFAFGIDPWWDDTWDWRKQINVSNPTAQNVFNYSIKMSVDTQSLISAGKMNSDCSDIRVTYYNSTSDSEQTTGYWIESGCNTTSTVIWAMVPYLPANGNSTLYMYYGNPAATSAEDPKEAFQYFVNFTSDDVYSYTSQDQDSSNYAVINDTTLHVWGNVWKYTGTTATVTGDGDQILEFDMKSQTEGEIQGSGVDDNTGNINSAYTYKFYGTQNWGIAPEQLYSGAGGWETVYAILDDYSLTGNFIFVSDDDANDASDTWFRNVRIRYYLSPEPSYSVGSEEFAGLYDISTDLPGNNFVVDRNSPFTFNGTVRCSRGNCRHTYSYSQYLSVSSPQTTVKEDSYADFAVRNESVNISISDVLALESNSSSWWNTAWTIRKNFTVTEQSGSDISNYAVNLSIDTQSLISAGKMNSDCSDMRFTYYNTTSGAEQTIGYWIESGCNTASTKVWVNVPYVPASGTSTIYMYYGNPDASSLSDPDSTFQYFVNFTTGGVHSYANQDADPSNFAVINDTTLHLWGNTWKYTDVTASVNGDGSQILELDMKSQTEGEIQASGVDNDPSTLSSSYTYKFYGTQNWGISPDKTYSGSGSWETVYAVLDDYSVNGNFFFTSDDDGNDASDTWFRNVRIRKYTNPEPSVSEGQEESISYKPSGYYISKSFDTGENSVFDRIFWDSEENENTSIKVYTRSSPDNNTWGLWYLEVNNTDIDAPDNRYFQYKVEMQTSNKNQTPYLSSITFQYHSSTTAYVDMGNNDFQSSNPYDCGPLNQTNQYCYPSWSVTPKTAGNFSIRIYANSSFMEDASSPINVTVLMPTTIADQSISPQIARQGDSIILKARLLDQLSQPVSGASIDFNDTTDSFGLGSNTTNSEGWAYLSHSISSESIGYHTINMSFSGDSSRFLKPSSATATYKVTSIPVIENVTATPDAVGNGYNVTISANVSDVVGVDYVWAEITKPDSTTKTIELSHTSGTGYSSSFTDTWEFGTYGFVVYANNTDNSTNSSSTQYFTVKSTAVMAVAPENTTYKNDQDVWISQYRSDWLNTSFEYRTPITVEETSGENLRHEPILIPINTSDLISQGKMNSDCSDMRFEFQKSIYELPITIDNTNYPTKTNVPVRIEITDSDALLEMTSRNGIRFFYNQTDEPYDNPGLSYWIDEITESHAVIWVLLNVTGSSTETIYMYFGDDSKPDLSDYDAVFTKVIGYAGTTSTDETWDAVSFPSQMTDPVVIASLTTANEYGSGTASAAVARIKGLSSSGFSVRAEEYPSGDGSHAVENISWIALEKGKWYYKGKIVQAGTTQSLSGETFSTFSFSPYTQTPTVLTQINSYNEADSGSHTRQDNPDESSSEVKIEEEHGNSAHVPETIGWMTFQQSSSDGFEAYQTGRFVDENWYDVSLGNVFSSQPIVVAKMMSEYGGDNADERIRSVSKTGFQLMVEETPAFDGAHTTENFGYVALTDTVLKGTDTDYSPDISTGQLSEIGKSSLEIPYWIESGCGTSNTSVWVNIPYLGSTSTSVIYMYYGNSSASSESSEEDVFDYSTSSPVLFSPATITTAVVSSFFNNTVVKSGTSSATLDERSATSLPISQGGEIEASRPVQASYSGNSGDSLIPGYLGSDMFVVPSNRYEEQWHVYALESGTFCAYEADGAGGWTELNCTGLSAGQAATIHGNIGGTSSTISDSATSVARVNGTGKFLLYKDTTHGTDSHPVPPPSSDVFGIPTSRLLIGILEDGTNVTIYYSDGTDSGTTYNNSYSAGDHIYISGYASDATGKAARIVSNKPIMAVQEADSDGAESTAFMPYNYLGRMFSIPFDASYIAMATLPGANCTLYAPDGSILSSGVATSSGTVGKWFYGGDSGTNIQAGSLAVCNESAMAIAESSSTSDEQNLMPAKLVRPYVSSDPLFSFGREETRDTGLQNVGDYPIRGYLLMDVQKKTDSGWEDIIPPVVNDRASGTLRQIPSGSRLDLKSIWQSAGGWNTDSNDPGYYRVYSALTDPDGNVLYSTYGQLSGYGKFKILEAVLSVQELKHENEWDYGINEYETGDTISWVNVTVIAENNTALDANVTLNVVDSNGTDQSWGPYEKKSCGAIAENSTCEREWDNSTNGYPIPPGLPEENASFFWDVQMELANGHTAYNKTMNFTIHNLTAGFNSSLRDSRIYLPNSTIYNFTIDNTWSSSLSDVNITVNCPWYGFNCTSVDSGEHILHISSLSSGIHVYSFNISVNSSASIGDYALNTTINYTNPGMERHQWENQTPKILEVRSPDLLEITFVDVPATVIRSEPFELVAKANNTASFSSANAWLNWTLPSGWTNSSGKMDNFSSSLSPGEEIWNNITVDSAGSSLGPQTVRADSGSDQGQDDWKTTTVYVYARTNTTGSLSTNQPNRGDVVTFSAHLVYNDTGLPVPNANIDFWDMTDNVFMGSATTGNDGTASISYTIPDNATLGNHTFLFNHTGSSATYTLDSSDNITVEVGAYPSITNVTATPGQVGYGMNVTITADATDEDGIDTVKLELWAPSGYSEHVMSNQSYHYNITLHELWDFGVYKYRIWANDTKGNSIESQEMQFEVNTSGVFRIYTDKTTYLTGKNVSLIGFYGNWKFPGWAYRRNFTLSSSATETDVEVNLSIDTQSLISDGKMNSDCSDMRFTYYNTTSGAEQEVPHWIESGCGTATTKVWVRMPEISSSEKIYMYYGNPASPDYSNKNETFHKLFVGEAVVNSTPKRISQYNISDPVVIAQPPSENDTESGTWRIANVTSTYFDVKFQEEPAQDGVHGNETLMYVVVPEGKYVLGNYIVQAGKYTTSTTCTGAGTCNWDTVDFPLSYSSTPIALAQIQTDNDDAFVYSVEQLVGTSSFQTAIGLPATVNSHGSETIGWVAVEQFHDTISGTKIEATQTPDAITGHDNGWTSIGFSQAYPVPPVVIATMQTHDGSDGGWLRRHIIADSSAQFHVDEDQMSDSEQSHTDEVAGMLIFQTTGNYHIRKYLGSSVSETEGVEEAIPSGSMFAMRHKTSTKLRILMEVEKNQSGTWTTISVVHNDTSDRLLNPDEWLDIAGIWNSTKWNTGSETGQLRIHMLAEDENGTQLSDALGAIEGFAYFNVTSPVNANITDMRIYNITDNPNTHTYTGDLEFEGLNSTIYLVNSNTYRFEIDINATKGNISISNLTVNFTNLNATWQVNLTDIWYSNLTGDNARADTNYEGGNFTGNVSWNTTKGGIIHENSTATFFFIVTIPDSIQTLHTSSIVVHPYFSKYDNSTLIVQELDTTPPQIWDSTYGMTVENVTRGENTTIYARWNEAIDSAKAEFNTTTSDLLNHTISLPDPNPENWTNYTIETLSVWSLGHRIAKIYATDKFSNENSTLPYLDFYVWGVADIDNGTLNASEIYIGDSVKMSCHVSDTTNSSNITGYTVYFYNSTSLLGTNTTGSDGWAYYTYADQTPGQETLSCNITNDTSRYYKVGTSSEQFTLLTKETIPPNYSSVSGPVIAHKTDSVILSSYWEDNYQLKNATLWTNSSGSFATEQTLQMSGTGNWSNFTYQIPSSFQPGYLGWFINASDTSGNTNQTPVQQIEVWGWSMISESSLNPSSIYVGNSTVMSCRVLDANSSSPIQGYEVKFYNSTSLLGTNTTGSDGWAYFNFTDNTTGQEDITCEISDSSGLKYNTTSQNSSSETLNTLQPGADADPPDADSYGLNATKIYLDQSLLVYAHWNETIDTAWAEFDTTQQGVWTTDTVPSPYTDNWTNYTLVPQNDWFLGNHSVKLYANDSYGNVNNTLDRLNFSVWSRAGVQAVYPAGGEDIDVGIVKLEAKAYDVVTGSPIQDYIVEFYDSEQGFIGSNTTNSSGIAVYYWNASSLTPDQHTLTILVRNDDSKYYDADPSEKQKDINFNLYGFLHPQIDSPSDGQSLLKNQTYWLNSTVYDQNSDEIETDALWHNSTTALTTGQDTTWSPPGSYPVGPSVIYLNVSKSYYHENQTNVSVVVYGIANATNGGPTANQSVNSTIPLRCDVVDAEGGQGISGYDVDFYINGTLVGSNLTNSSGTAIYHWDSTGEPEGTYEANCTISDNLSLYYYAGKSNENWTFNLTKVPFYLEVHISEPLDSQIVGQNRTFRVNATAICRSGDCGDVYGEARYNASSSADTPIPTSPADPFWIPAGVNNHLCGSLQKDENCTITWDVNASGSLRGTYLIDARFTAGSYENDTSDRQVEIGKVIVMTVNFSSVQFGSQYPSPIFNKQYNGTENNNGGYKIIIEPESNDIDYLWISGTNLTSQTTPSTIGVGNMTWNTTNSGNGTMLNYTYDLIGHDVPSNSTRTLYFWLWIPPVYYGDYNGTIYIKANSTW